MKQNLDRWILVWLVMSGLLETGLAQQAPYDVYPAAAPPYYRVRYDASETAGELQFAVNYTIWIPPGVTQLRGVVVHQHGCGEGSCSSGLTGAYDLHWQALAAAHDCALLSPSYEQPQSADCQLWCDPRNGSAAAFLRGLNDLGQQSGHAELSEVPWALWGHSGGGHWAGGMTLLYPQRVAAAWLRSGVPLLQANPDRPAIRAHQLADAVLSVPIMCNPGTKEGVTVTDGRFAGVWPANLAFFGPVRQRGGLIGVAIDPLSSHECGNQRYMAIRWLDECLRMRLPAGSGGTLRAMPAGDAWLTEVPGTTTAAETEFGGDKAAAGWLPSGRIAALWKAYVTDTEVPDQTPPPAPTMVRVADGRVSWTATADLESGIAQFIVLKDGKEIGRVPEQPKNRFGRGLFQDLQYSDTPAQPLAEMAFADAEAVAGQGDRYRVIAVNTVGLHSGK
ncbi:MAG: hypothetical protein ACO3FE_14775 [Planctomycetaceae bacterium]